MLYLYFLVICNNFLMPGNNFLAASTMSKNEKSSSLEADGLCVIRETVPALGDTNENFIGRLLEKYNFLI